MPCTDGGPSYEQIQQELEDHNTMTRLACAYCKSLEKNKIPVPLWALSWWSRHQLADKAREQEELDRQEKEKARRNALAKLSKKEREALGVDR